MRILKLMSLSNLNRLENSESNVVTTGCGILLEVSRDERYVQSRYHI